MNDVKKPSLPEMIVWHREQAAHLRRSEAVMRSEGDAELAGAYARIAAHHEVAAAVLDALAVPGVAEWIESIAKARAFTVDDDEPMSNRPVDLTDDVRAALATLASVGRGP